MRILIKTLFPLWRSRTKEVFLMIYLTKIFTKVRTWMCQHIFDEEFKFQFKLNDPPFT